MKNAIRFDKALDCKTGLFTAKSKKENYLFVLVHEEKYLGIKVSETELKGVEDGTKDISQIYRNPKSKLFYPCSVDNHKNIKMKSLQMKDLIKEFLCPEKGLYLKQEKENGIS